MKKISNKLSILIPVYNEEKTVAKVLKRTISLPIDKYEVIVVNDASIDKSGEIIAAFKKSFDLKNVTLKIINRKKNMGKGAAIKTGIKHASGEYFVIQDADFEYDSREIPRLLTYAQENKIRVVYGSRFLGNISRMPRANYIANVFYNVLLRILYGKKITDMHTCYKMVKTDLLRSLDMQSNSFDYATELVSKLLKRKVTIHELPISFHGRTKSEGKKINIMDGVECLYKLFVYRFIDITNSHTISSIILLRFFIVGTIGFFVNYGILVVLTELGSLNHVPAEMIAALIAFHVTFFLHDKWTYALRVNDRNALLSLRARYGAFIASNSIGAAMTVVVFAITFNFINRLPALLIGAVCGLVWNYIINGFVIWRTKKVE